MCVCMAQGLDEPVDFAQVTVENDNARTEELLARLELEETRPMSPSPVASAINSAIDAALSSLQGASDGSPDIDGV